MNQPPFNLSTASIAIVGLGLMGGSMALALRGKCARLVGLDTHQPTLDLALSQNIVDEAGMDPFSLLPAADLIFLAAPVLSILDWLQRLPEYCPNPCIVMDLGSTKQLITDAMSRLPARFDPLGGHPICGKEKLSLAHAERTLYYSAPFVLTPLPRTSQRALSAAHQVIEALGAIPKLLPAAEHDRILSDTSHLPFLVSSALVLATPPDVAPYIGPGFKSTSRLAGTSSSMMLGVLQSNRQNVLDALRRLKHQMGAIETALDTQDFTSLEALLNQAQQKFHSLNT